MTILGSIRARGGFDLRPFAGKPLITHTIEQALACGRVDRVLVSTDSPDLARIAEQAGAEVVPLTGDAGPTGVKADLIVDLDPRAPLRDVADIGACIDQLDDGADAVLCGYEAEKNPYFNIVELTPDGAARLCKPPTGAVVARQAAPRVYALSSAVTVRRGPVLDQNLPTSRNRLHVLPRERALVIEDELDFRLAELLMRR